MKNIKTKNNNILSLPEIEVQNKSSIRFVSKAVNIIFIISVFGILSIIILFLSVDINSISDVIQYLK